MLYLFDKIQIFDLGKKQRQDLNLRPRDKYNDNYQTTINNIARKYHKFTISEGEKNYQSKIIHQKEEYTKPSFTL